HGTWCSSDLDQSSSVQSPSGRPAKYAATAGCSLHQPKSLSLPMTSIWVAGIPASNALSVKVFSRSCSPFRPFVELVATPPKRPPLVSVSLGMRFVTSRTSRDGSPATPALNCQHVSALPSQSSGLSGCPDQPSQPSSLALPSVLTRI